MSDVRPAVSLNAWTEADLSLLWQTNTPEMMAHLGGPETEDKILDRHRRYLLLDDPGVGQMFAVVIESGERVGTIGYWERDWRDELVYETGWMVIPEFQGRGIASAAAKAVAERARAQRRHKYLHAFPAADHHASNAICRKAGFALRGETDVEYPPGTIMRCNDWVMEL